MTGRNHGALDGAIALYIDGQYARAAEKLLELTGELEDAEDLRTAYLYLGRANMSLADYVGAADAFSRGKSLGGGVEFDEHLAAAQQHLRSAPGTMGLQPLTTRGQLAALIDNLFGERLVSDSLAGDGGAAGGQGAPSDVQGHWARQYIQRVRAADIMSMLPDGRFHPDAPVTYPAFYVTVLRLSEAVGLPRWAIDSRFPGGWTGAVSRADEGAGRPRGSTVVTGRDAEEILRTLRDAPPVESSD
jgi:hypothetical protein